MTQMKKNTTDAPISHCDDGNRVELGDNISVMMIHGRLNRSHTVSDLRGRCIEAKHDNKETVRC
jgi:hypothetical protein